MYKNELMLFESKTRKNYKNKIFQLIFYLQTPGLEINFASHKTSPHEELDYSKRFFLKQMSQFRISSEKKTSKARTKSSSTTLQQGKYCTKLEQYTEFKQLKSYLDSCYASLGNDGNDRLKGSECFPFVITGLSNQVNGMRHLLRKG